MPPGYSPEWTINVQVTRAPDQRRGDGVFAVESRRWLICAIGAGGERTPTDEQGFLEFLRGLDNPMVAECAEHAKPAGELYPGGQPRQPPDAVSSDVPPAGATDRHRRRPL
ncbi:hypothetical protein [Actinophytocola sp.]|uniref:hypothetical protein n=1 Tax=Actinophytocola sp. TaxID=1872138 RepID=UPI002ED66ED4